MKATNANSLGKSKSPASSIILYIVAILLFIAAIALLVSNVLFYRTSISQYVAQGYTQAEVVAQLRPSQLFPGIFQSLLMVGISFLLWSAGLLNQKITNGLNVLTAADVVNDDVAPDAATPESELAETAPEFTEDTSAVDAEPVKSPDENEKPQA